MRQSHRQCQAVTVASTYSASHRCLKQHGVQRSGASYLCSHHRAAAARPRA
jgi:GTP cyclohydrolase I